MRYQIFTGGERNALYDILFQDLRGREQIRIVSMVPKIPDGVSGIWKIHHSERLNGYVKLPFRSLWNRYNPMRDFQPEGRESYCFIFSNVAIEWYEPALLRQWQKRFGVKLVLYLLDTLDSYYASGARMALKNIQFDAVYTYYRPDAEKYGFCYFDTYYSKLHDICRTQKERKTPADVFFWGSEKGRGKMLRKVNEVLKRKGCSTEFGICYVEELAYAGSGICCNKELSYREMIERINASTCILDLKGENSKGISLRAYEAYVYGKRLLTNNPQIRDMRGYSKDWVQYFEDPEEIRVDFIRGHDEKKRIYHDEFSPVHFIERLEREL